MDRITHDDIKEIVDATDHPAITLTMPTFRAGREVRQNATRFKNLLKKASSCLEERFPNADKMQSQLKKLEKLQHDDNWWQHQSDGLALFVGADFDRRYRMPIELDEIVTVGRQFRIVPLIRYLQDDGRFYLLAVSQNRVRLFEGTHYEVTELQPEDLPTDLRSALNIDEYVSSLQPHSAGQPNTAGSMLFHGHGGSDLDVKKKDEIKQFFYRINEALDSYFGVERTPLVFAGVEYLFPIFRETCNYNSLFDESVTGNPDDMGAEELHCAAWKLVSPMFTKERDDALAQFEANRDDPRTIQCVSGMLRAAKMGAVETFLLHENREFWASVNKETGEAEELLNEIASETLKHGGKVYLYDTKKVLSKTEPAAALLRYPLPEKEAAEKADAEKAEASR